MLVVCCVWFSNAQYAQLPFAGPVAQSVEHWTLRGERTRPGKKCPGFEARRALDVYDLLAGMVPVGQCFPR